MSYVPSPLSASENTSPIIIENIAADQPSGRQVLDDTWNDLCSKHQVKSWYIETLKKTSGLVSGENGTSLPLLGLLELGDSEGRFDRKTSPVRANIEKAIVQDINHVLEKEPLTTPVRILSIGCLGQLQDWYIVGQLIREGRTTIDLSIVEKQFFPELIDSMSKLSDGLEQEGIHLKASYFNSVEQCASAQKKPFHAAYAVLYYDLYSFQKNTWSNLTKARKLLAPNGHLSVSFQNEILTIDATGKVSVIESDPRVQLMKKTIVDALRSDFKSKDRSLRLFVTSSDLFFYTTSLLYAISDLVDDGFTDITVFSSMPRTELFSTADLSAVISDAAANRASVSLRWAKISGIRDKRADRRDIVIFNLPHIKLDQATDFINHDVVLLGLVMSDNGHWIISADQLGIWDVKANGNAKAVLVPQGQEKSAREIIEKIFKRGGGWLPNNW